MTVRPADLQTIPLFRGITEEHLATLMGAFERLSVDTGRVLFEAGAAPTHLLLLVSGELALHEPGTGTDPRFLVHPLAAIGELGAVTGIQRATTAVVTQPSEIWQVDVATLNQFFEDNGDVAFPLYHNLLGIVADKMRRDSRRVDEMRSNLIRTQKAMKRLLDVVFESEETPLSKSVAETLEDLIEHNKRSHYRVEPGRALASSVRLDGGTVVPVLEISDGLLRIGASSPPLEVGTDWSGVLVTPVGEVPVSGRIESVDSKGVLIKLDLLIDTYNATLRDYLTRVQMLDFVV